MWSRSQGGGPGSEDNSPPELSDGAALVEGQVRLEWTLAETVGFRLFFPEPFVVTYAYPLIIFLHDEKGSDSDLDDWFPAVSGQNFLAAAVRGPFPHNLGMPGTYSWPRESLPAAQKLVGDAIDSISRLWRVHTGRTYLMGLGLGGEMALQLVMKHHSPYAGGIAVAPRQVPLQRRDETAPAKKRLLLVNAPYERSISRFVDDARDAEHEVMLLNAFHGSPNPLVCDRINRWLMKGIPSTIW